MLAVALLLGTLTLSADTGAVTQSPMLSGVTTSAACPVGYGTNAAVKVGRPGGPYFNLAPIGSANNYDAAAFTLPANRSMAKALTGSDAGAVADGGYEIVVLCAGETLGDHPDRFSFGITVTGGTWRAGATTPPPSQPSGSNGQVQIIATVASGPSAPPLPRTGAPLITYIGAGILLIGVGAAAVRFFRRQTNP